MGTDLNPLLEIAFPAITDAEVVRGVTEGVLLADDLIKNTPMLKHLGGFDLRGHLRRAGIMFRLNDLCDRGILPFATDIVQMPHGPWHWLEIRSDKFKAHVCRTNSPLEFPDDTLSRQDERLRNQTDLFNPKVMTLSEIAERASELYAWLTFGADKAGNILHLCWAMPPADETDWLAHINVLERFRVSAAPNPTPSEPPKKLKLEFREHVEEKLTQIDKKSKG
jgi:hypothetical protein